MRMYWLRPALLYLFITGLLCAGVWLFWGDAISQGLKSDNRHTRKEPAGRLAGTVREKTPPPKKMKPVDSPVNTQQVAVSGKEAWDKASSGFGLLLQTAGGENRRLLLESVAEQDQRYRAMFPKLAERQPSAHQVK